MKLQTVIEQLREASPEGTTAARPRLTCRWDRDTSGKLACFWTPQPKEEASVYRALEGVTTRKCSECTTSWTERERYFTTSMTGGFQVPSRMGWSGQ